MSTNRMIRNYVLDSALQFRFAATAMAVFLILVAGVVGYSYIYLDKIMIAIFDVPDVPDGAISIYESMIGGYFTGLAMLLVSMGSFAVAIVVVQTHKIAGAKFAIIRHIKEDMQMFRFDRSIKLRDSDYLHDLAFEINRLCELINAKGILLPDPASLPAYPQAAMADSDNIKTREIEEVG